MTDYDENEAENENSYIDTTWINLVLDINIQNIKFITVGWLLYHVTIVPRLYVLSKKNMKNVKRIRATLRLSWKEALLRKKAFIFAPWDGFIAPLVWEIVGRKNLTIFKGCRYSWFCMVISSSFRVIETKNLNSDPCILLFLVLETT